MNNNIIIIFITCSSKKEAEVIAGVLLKKRLVACANMVHNISSKFWWNGKIDKAGESLVMVKTKRSLFPGIEREVKKLHSYELPEIIAIPVIAGSKDYLNWVKRSVA